MAYSFYSALRRYGVKPEFFKQFLIPTIREFKVQPERDFYIDAEKTVQLLQIKKRGFPGDFFYLSIQRKPSLRSENQSRSHLVVGGTIHLPLNESSTSRAEEKIGSVEDPSSFETPRQLLGIPLSLLPSSATVSNTATGVAKAVIEVDPQSFDNTKRFIHASNVVNSYVDALSMLNQTRPPRQFIRMAGLHVEDPDSLNPTQALAHFLEANKQHHDFLRKIADYSTHHQLEESIRRHFELGPKPTFFSEQLARITFKFVNSRLGREAAKSFLTYLPESPETKSSTLTSPSDPQTDSLLRLLRKKADEVKSAPRKPPGTRRHNRR